MHHVGSSCLEGQAPLETGDASILSLDDVSKSIDVGFLDDIIDPGLFDENVLCLDGGLEGQDAGLERLNDLQ